MTSDVITLADGRRLHWHEFGDPDGSPVLYTAGTPVSGLGGAAYDEAARAAGLRWVAPDKPGYGGSDYQRKRSVSGWADDLTALAGHLGLDHFALAGESGGAPFTLTAAHSLADRVSVVFRRECRQEPHPHPVGCALIWPNSGGSPLRSKGLDLAGFGLDSGLLNYAGTRQPALHPDVGAQ